MHQASVRPCVHKKSKPHDYFLLLFLGFLSVGLHWVCHFSCVLVVIYLFLPLRSRCVRCLRLFPRGLTPQFMGPWTQPCAKSLETYWLIYCSVGKWNNSFANATLSCNFFHYLSRRSPWQTLDIKLARPHWQRGTGAGRWNSCIHRVKKRWEVVRLVFH